MSLWSGSCSAGERRRCDHVAADTAVVAADGCVPVAQFPRLHDVVVARILAASRRGTFIVVVGATVSCANAKDGNQQQGQGYSLDLSSQEHRIGVRAVDANVA